MSYIEDMTSVQVDGICRLCYQEQGSAEGAAAEASLAINRYRMYGLDYGSLYDYMRDSRWWAKSAYYMDSGRCPDDAQAAVQRVLEGHLTIPEYLDEHDCFPDIDHIEIDGETVRDHRIFDRSSYIKGRTVIYNRYGAVYTFYCFPATRSDPFGHTDNAFRLCKSKVESACEWMENLARDPSHGYDQEHRWGENGDYDCSSAVITAWELAGVPVKSNGASYTGDMCLAFCNSGFKDVVASVDLPSGEGLERGDVLLNDAHHTCMYIGDHLVVEASSNEVGGATGGEPGDQTGREVRIRSYYNFPWDHVLRYTEGVDSVKTGTVKIPFAYLETGCKGDAVRLLQASLNIVSGANLDEDGEFGELTKKALIKYQASIGARASGRLNKGTVRGLLQDAILDTYTVKVGK